MHFDTLWRRFVAAGAPAMNTVYSNKDGYTRNSVRVDDDGYISVYDRIGKSLGLQGVEISYALITKAVVSALSLENTPVEDALYVRLAERRQLLAHVTDHRYYSVGALHRLPLTETFLARRPAVILDRDGVLNKRPPRAHYVRRWEEFEWLPGALEALRLFTRANYRVIVVSNQAGIGRGAMTDADVQGIHERMRTEVERAGSRIDAIYYCPHDWQEDCECRKPKPGLLFQAQKDLSLDLTRTPFIGDDERDRQAADSAGCPSALVSSELSLLDIARRLVADA
jgi:D-glycero-D-manno-heptose 1,7-bisphosphate phosphatase